MTQQHLQPPALPPARGPLLHLANALFGIERDSVDQTLSGVMCALWRKRLIIAAFTLLGALGGFATASLLEKKYVVYMRIIPNVDDQLGGGGAGRLGALGSLSSLASGLAKPERVTAFQQYLALMTSQEVASEMQRRGNFLAALYPTLWDAEKKRWSAPPSDLLSRTKRFVKQTLGLPTPPHPTEEDLSKEIARRVGVSDNPDVSIYVVSMAHKDPAFAQTFIQTLYESTETVLLRRDQDVAARKVKAAERELGATTITTSRDALADILVMLNLRLIQTNVGSPYAAQILSRVEVSDFPSIPSVPNYIIYGLLIGLLAPCLIIAVVALARGRKAA